MKTIEEAAKDFNDSHVNGHHPQIWVSDIFKAGVDFSQRWISIDEELPPVSQQVIVKLKNNWHACTWLLGDGTFAFNVKPTHWRYIDLK